MATACQDDEQLMETTSTEWSIPSELLSIDSCFFPESYPFGPQIIPPTQGNEIHKIAFDPLDDNAIYITTWKRTSPGIEAFVENSELYRLDLVQNTSTFISTLTDFNQDELMLNQHGELLSEAMGEGLTIFDLSSLELIQEQVVQDEYTSLHGATWITDATFWLHVGIFAENGQPGGALVRYTDTGLALDTFEHRSSNILQEVSPLRNEQMIITSRSRVQYSHSLYLYDLAQNELVDSLEKPSVPDFRVENGLGRPYWLNDQQVLLQFTTLFLLADLASETYQVVPSQLVSLTSGCRNYQISSVQVVPNRPNEILYVLNQFFYTASGEYRKRHDLIHLNVETGEERVLLIDL
ncbi:MAG: hypothetical protein AAFU60_06280 [Bacteroidota bacterium]